MHHRPALDMRPPLTLTDGQAFYSDRFSKHPDPPDWVSYNNQRMMHPQNKHVDYIS